MRRIKRIALGLLTSRVLLISCVCVLAFLGSQIVQFPITSVSCWVSLLVLAIAVLAFCCLAGVSAQTWRDPVVALGTLLIGCCLILHAVLVTGAYYFGPVLDFDTRFSFTDRNDRDIFLWRNGAWLDARLPSISLDQAEQLRRWDWQTLREDLRVPDAHTRVSLWDRRIHLLESLNDKRQVRIQDAPLESTKLVVTFELLLGIAAVGGAFTTWRSCSRLGIQFKRVQDIGVGQH